MPQKFARFFNVYVRRHHDFFDAVPGVKARIVQTGDGTAVALQSNGRVEGVWSMIGLSILAKICSTALFVVL